MMELIDIKTAYICYVLALSSGAKNSKIEDFVILPQLQKSKNQQKNNEQIAYARILEKRQAKEKEQQDGMGNN